MRIILLKDVKGLGRKGEVREVNDGYARNALIPKKLAQIATSSGIESVKNDLMQKKEAHDAKIAHFKQLSKSIESAKVQFSLKAGNKGELFGSVTTKDIQSELKKFNADEADVILEHPIKTIGMHPVIIDFGDGIRTTIQVEVKEEK